MKKNDKLIVLFGVVILVMASVGVYYWAPEKAGERKVGINQFIEVSGILSNAPYSITVSDKDPLYSLIATPLAVHYSIDGQQEVLPLYIENFDNPSTDVERVRKEQLGLRSINEYIVDGSKSAKEVSLDIAQKFWKSSEAALLIEDNESGYSLGVIAAPLASYISIPVIVTNQMDQDVIRVLNDLGVKYTIVCGKNIEGYGEVLRFNSVEEIVDATIEILQEKFGTINYVTLTNPVDAYPPAVLDSKEFSFGPTTIGSFSSSQLPRSLFVALQGKNQVSWSFTIPKDYKYALIKFEGINLDADDVEACGDSVDFMIGPDLPDLPAGLQTMEITGGTAGGGVPVRDADGNIITDKIYNEVVLYGRGGVTYTIKASGAWIVKKQGRVSAHVTVEKLENPVYPMMKGLSSIAPYLTAYHRGIVFGKPEFAFTADDNVITDKGQTCPGIYVGGKNIELVPLSNEHFFDKIYDPLNALLAKLAGITMEDDRDIKSLREHYKEAPIYIALVGDATVLPNYFYQNIVEPVGDINGDGVAETPWFWGGGTPSDILYGDIDPVRYDWSNLAGDIYSEYPYVENIVGRITGWDAQDASALVARSIFYNEIISNMDTWKNNFGLLVGGGQDFQKPLLRTILFSKKAGEPMKLFTGYTEMTFKRAQYEIVKPLEFNVQAAMGEKAMRKGLSEDVLTEIKQATLVNRFAFSKAQVRRLAGEGVVKGGDIFESSNFLFINGHGCQHYFGLGSSDLVASGMGGPIIKAILGQTLIPIAGGFTGPGGSLSKVGDYNTRAVSNMELGPSFMWLESCICGKMDGIYSKVVIGQSFLHAGITSLIASPTGSNIGGGYLEPKNRMYDLPGSIYPKYLKDKKQWAKGIFPDTHFGEKIYEDLCADLRDNNVSVGLAFRNAKNSYLPADANWELWWSPPLITTGNSLLDKEITKNSADLYKSISDKGKGKMLESKYTSFQEYMLFGDPAFNPYEPCNEGIVSN